MKRIILGGLMLFGIGQNVQAVLVGSTYESTASTIEVGGVTQVDDRQAFTNAFASSQGIWPDQPAPPAQARTAARAGDREIAANARIANTSWTLQSFDMVMSQASYYVDSGRSPLAFDGRLDFHLPASYLEATTNVEARHDEITGYLMADLRVCVGTAACGLADRRLLLQATLSGSHDTMWHAETVTGDPTLDLSPLTNPTVTDTNGVLFRTYNVTFGEVLGHLELGIVPADTNVHVEYTLQAAVRGPTRMSSVIAAINDPFFLTTDPVTPGAPFTLETAPVPLPPALLLFAPAVAVLSRRRRRR